MARKIFIAATSQNCGKTTLCLSLLHLAQKKYPRIGFIKPLGPKPSLYRGLTIDKDAALVAQVFGLTRDLKFMSPVIVERGTTRQALEGKLDTAAMQDRILESFRKLESRCDFIIVEGSGHPGVGSVLQLSNARICPTPRHPGPNGHRRRYRQRHRLHLSEPCPL